MSDYTAQELLEAVGVDWRNESHLHTWHNGLTSTCIYTGPALGTPELDAILLVEGQRLCVGQDSKTHGAVYEEIGYPGYEITKCYGPLDWLIFQCPTPGHALARAIKEVGK